MKISGKSTIDAPRDQVWEALNNMEVLARIVPGCERLEQVGDNEYEGTVKIGIQSIKGTYSGKIRLEDIEPPRHYKLVAAGRSANGVVDGTGTVDLEELEDGKTLLNYGGDAQIGGTLASVGQRLIEGASKQLINQSLKALAEQIKQRNAPPAEAADAAPADAAPAPEPATAASAPAASSAPSAVAEAEQAAPAATPEASTPTTTETPAAPAKAAPPSFERRTVVVPSDEQLKPESIVRGMVEDALQERPWVPWVVIAFLLGILFGRAGRK